MKTNLRKPGIKPLSTFGKKFSFQKRNLYEKIF